MNFPQIPDYYRLSKEAVHQIQLRVLKINHLNREINKIIVHAMATTPIKSKEHNATSN